MREEKPVPEIKTFKHIMKAGHASAPEAMEVNVVEGDLPPWDLDTKLSVVGGRQTRLEAPDKVTGRARYTFDIKLPGMLWGQMVRAAIPAGKIVAVDTSRAEALPGVKAVWLAESQHVRFAGQDVAAVAATSPEIAADAARLVKVTYQEKAFVSDIRQAMEPGAAPVYEPEKLPPRSAVLTEGNVVTRPPEGRRLRGDIDQGFEEAEVEVQGSYEVPVHAHLCLETHGVLAHWEGERLTVYASTQGVFSVRNGLAEALGIDRKNVKVVTEHMGGGFGSKLGPSATGSAFAVAACRLAKSAGAPVKLMLDRHEEHLCTGNAPGALMTTRIGAKRDGTFTALHHRSFGTAGISDGAGTGGPAASLYGRCPNRRVEDNAVFINAGPAAPLRAPGHSQGAFALESTVDELAEKLGLDPLELRRKNTENPVRLLQYDLGARAIGWERRNPKPRKWIQQGERGPRRGLGMANGNWYVIARDQGVAAEVRIHQDGSVEVFSGAQDIGTGYRTAMAVVAAEVLGLRPADVQMNVGDSRWPEGPGSGGSNTTNTMAPVVRLAAHQVREKLFAAAAPGLGTAPEKLAAAGGKVFVAAEPSRALSFKQAAARMPGDTLSATAERRKQFETYRRDLAGMQFCEVEVDVETGVVQVLRLVGVHDCGLPMNRLAVESQIIGAMIQGVSWALYEDRILDRNVGTMVNPNTESYKVLMPADMFEAQVVLTPIANGGNNTSSAGIGEPPIVPTLAAVANAVYNATGARVRRLPMTPDRVLAALAEARRRI